MTLDFGSDLSILLFEKITTTLKTYISHLLKNTIALYEPRIDLEKITIDDSGWVDGLLLIELSYFIKTTNLNQKFPTHHHVRTVTDKVI